MIQEFIISGVMEDKKLSIIGKGPLSDSTSPFLSTSTTSATTTTAEPPPQNLRCPRCDSSNTKFCYYNNYNLTQPRHFCKTCRRYWTKGGALRNIPIGGSCRKAKPSPVISSAATAKPAASNPIPIARAALEPDPEPEIPTLWAAPAPPHTSHLLALLRASGIGGIQYPNTNTLHCLNPIKSKEQAMAAEPARGCGMGFSGLSLDPLGQFSTAAGIGSLWRNEGQLPYMQNPVPLQAENNPPFGDAVAGVQDLYQMLRLPAMATAYCSGWSAPASSALATAASVAGGGGGGDGAGAAATALEASLRGEFGNWNPALAWSDMSTIN